MPRVHTVQTTGAWPLARALERVAARLPAEPGPEEIRAAVRYAAGHRSEFMWPWETVPHSLAHGILDDETYDWVAVVEAMLNTGGRGLVVNEEEIADANALAVEATGIEVDETGSAGLAGLTQLCRRGLIGPTNRLLSCSPGPAEATTRSGSGTAVSSRGARSSLGGAASPSRP